MNENVAINQAQLENLTQQIYHSAKCLEIPLNYDFYHEQKKLGRSVVEQALGGGNKLWEHEEQCLGRDNKQKTCFDTLSKRLMGQSDFEHQISPDSLSVTEMAEWFEQSAEPLVNIQHLDAYCLALADCLYLYADQPKQSYTDKSWLSLTTKQISDEYSTLFDMALSADQLENLRQTLMRHSPVVGIAALGKAEYRLIAVQHIITGKSVRGSHEDRYFKEYKSLLEKCQQKCRKDDFAQMLLRLAELAHQENRTRMMSASFILKQLKASGETSELLKIAYESLPRGGLDVCFSFV